MLSQAWDDLRRRILQEALTQYLLPALEREARSRLAGQAREVVVQEASDKLWAYASQAPLQVWGWRGCVSECRLGLELGGGGRGVGVGEGDAACACEDLAPGAQGGKLELGSRGGPSSRLQQSRCCRLSPRSLT